MKFYFIYKVSATFTTCNQNAHFSCNCAVQVECEATLVTLDHCGVSTINKAALKFVSNDGSGFEELDFAGHVVNTSQAYNSAWFDVTGNALDVNGKFKAARIRGTFSYVVIKLSFQNVYIVLRDD